MKKYIVATILTLSLVVGLLITGPANIANAETINCSDIKVQATKISLADESKIADLLNNVCSKFNIDSDWINTVLDKYADLENCGSDNTASEEEVETPVETPDNETPVVIPDNEDSAETPTEETPDTPTENPPEETPETPAENPPEETPETPAETPSGLTAEQARMLELVNQERANAGLSALEWDAEVANVANIKAQDMVDNDYFSHTSPTYGSPFDMMKSFGITYRTAGENLAGYSSVEGAHNGLMNSDGHRANILNSSFTHIGIGVQKSPKYGYVFVQMFIGK